MTTTDGKIVVLIVEDQAPLRVALRDFLGLYFPVWHVFEAVDGATAMKAFIEQRPSLVLMDICLPDTNGIELTRRVKALVPETVVVVMSIQRGARIAELALAAGAVGFLRKDRVFTELAPLLTQLSHLPGSRR